MIAIAVDDEVLMLGALVEAIKASPDITEVIKFSGCDETLKFVKDNPVDIAFLDINMRGMGGLALAEKIVDICSDCKIVFCTGYEEYAVSAFKLHASGYLLKPVSAEDVQVEIDNIKGIRQKEKPIEVKCFGNFEVYAKGEKLTFKRSKTKELFAFLVDRNGAGVTVGEIEVALWENDEEQKNQNYIHQLFRDLRQTLGAIGMENIFERIIERNTPSKYTMTVEKRDTSFVLTNTYIPENSSKDPQTGDTSNIMLYVILMIVSGSILIIIGVMGKRDVHEKTK